MIYCIKNPFQVATNTTFRAYRYANAWSASRAESPSNSYIQITPMGAAARGELGVNDMAQFTIRATDNLSKYRVMVRFYNIVDSIRSRCCFNIMWLLIFKVLFVRFSFGSFTSFLCRFLLEGWLF